MRAAMCERYGAPDVVDVIDTEPPALGANGVRVAVEAASVNFSDVLLVAGEYQIKVPPPFIPGSEFAGVVREVADGLVGVRVGDRVAGTIIVGAFAEEVVASATALRPVPSGVSLDIAAAFGVAHRTAYHALRSVGDLKAGDELVVLGAGGGVGLAAVQIGVALGATVTAVAGGRDKLDVAASYGATHVIDRTDGDVRSALKAALPGGSDVVLDPVGGDLSEPALRSLRWRGRFVTVGFATGTIPRIPLNLVLLKGCEIRGFEIGSFMTRVPDLAARDEAELMALFAEAKVRPHIGRRYTLDDVVGALTHVGDGKAIGKVVLDIAGQAGA
jgi:NADPH2:quinone reductase